MLSSQKTQLSFLSFASVNLISLFYPNLASAVLVTNQDNIREAILTASGGPVGDGFEANFSTTSSLWSFNGTIIGTNGGAFSNDTLRLHGFARHTSDPHHPEETNGGNFYAYDFGTNGTAIDQGNPSKTFESTILGRRVHVGLGHEDVFQGKLSGELQENFYSNDILSWKFVIHATHPYFPNPPLRPPVDKPVQVQVPAPLPILGLGAFFGYNRKLRKLFKASKPELISPI